MLVVMINIRTEEDRLGSGVLPKENAKGNDSIQVVTPADATTELGLDICKGGQPEDKGDEVKNDEGNTEDSVQLAGDSALASIEPRQDQCSSTQKDSPAGREDDEDQDTRGTSVNGRVHITLIGVPGVHLGTTSESSSDIGTQAQLDNGKDQGGAQQDVKDDMEGQHGCEAIWN